MNLGALLDRCYSVLGDDKADPREFPRQPLVDAANRGCLAFRVSCHEVWRRADIPAVASQGEYTIPADMLSLQRVAYDDGSLEARAANTLQSRDVYWLTQTGQPISFTSYGLAFNKFRLWPIPAESTDEPWSFTGDTQVIFNGNPVTWDSSRGIVVRYQETGGANYTLTRDPASPVTWSFQRGLTVSLSSVDFTTDYGELLFVTTTANKQITLWGTEKPAVLSDDAQEIPIRQAWQIGILYFMLWGAYDEEGDHHNQVLAAFYRDAFFDQITRCKERVSTSVPTQVTKLRGGAVTELGEITYGDVIVNGNPIPVLW